MAANDESRKARKQWFDTLSPEERKARMSKAARARWAKTTPEERKAHSRKMNGIL